jgi:hypothetical protein
MLLPSFDGLLFHTTLFVSDVVLSPDILVGRLQANWRIHTGPLTY